MERFPLSEVKRRSLVLDFGTPAAHRYMKSGWGKDMAGMGTGLPVVWGTADRSILEFRVKEPRDVILRFQGAPLKRYSAAPPQTVYVGLNGLERWKQQLEPFLREYRIALPGHAFREGTNELVFRYQYSEFPSVRAPGPDIGEPLAVEWDYVELLFAASSTEARADPASKVVFVPFGSQVRYYAKLPESNRFSYDGLSFTGRRRAEVQLVVQRDGGETQKYRLRPSSTRQEVAFRLPEPSVASLTIEAMPTGGQAVRAGSGGAVLIGPKVTSVPSAVGSASVGRLTSDEVSAPQRSPRPNIILYLVDTLRADHLGCYGYARPTSPNIVAFAEESVVFENTIAQSPWTRPSVASIFTGLCPQHHGINDRDDAMPGDAQTLAGILNSNGYETVAFLASGVISRPFGFANGFSNFVFLPETDIRAAYKLSDAVNEKVWSWLDTNKDPRPFFLYIHTMDPHSPYRPKSDFRKKFAGNVPVDELDRLSSPQKVAAGGTPPSQEDIEHMRSLYDAEIAFNDHHFGALLDRLRQMDLFDDSLILFVADHGEEFYEHGRLGHAKTFYSEVLNVPLIVKLPARASTGGRRVSSVARQIDILPTILDYLGLETPPQVEGRSLLNLLPFDAVTAPAFSYLRFDGWQGASVVSGEWKLSRHGRYRELLELYNTADDRDEKTNLADTYPILAGYLNSLIDAHGQEHPVVLESRRADVDDKLLENLKALGYVN